MSVSIALVCEAQADATTARDLSDRVVCDVVSWIDEDNLEHLRVWRGETAGADFLAWKNVGRLLDQKNIRVPHGQFNGAPGAPDAHAARRALRLLRFSESPPDAVLLIRDDDGDSRRRVGLEQARSEREKGDGLPVVIGVATTKRECWVLAGFIAQDPIEKSALEGERKKLGFDPTKEAERLKDKRGEVRDAKRVLAALTDNDWDRQTQCWQITPLAHLKAQETKTGIAEFLTEVEDRIVPLVRNSSH